MDAQDKVARDPPEVLHKKYREYRSAQIAGILLYLPVEDVYALAQRTASADDRSHGFTYGRMVELATDWISNRAPIPPYDVWLADYQANPSAYEEYLMGLWKTDERP